MNINVLTPVGLQKANPRELWCENYCLYPVVKQILKQKTNIILGLWCRWDDEELGERVSMEQEAKSGAWRVKNLDGKF